jgi:hypothetical protein
LFCYEVGLLYVSAVGYGAWLNLLKGKLMETLIRLYITKIEDGWTMSDEEIAQFDKIQLLYMNTVIRRMEKYGAYRNKEG